MNRIPDIASLIGSAPSPGASPLGDMGSRMMLAMLKAQGGACSCDVCTLLRQGAKALEDQLSRQLLGDSSGAAAGPA